VISFLMLAVYWQAHHRVFKPITGYDRTLVWLTFLFLMAIAFLPFPTSNPTEKYLVRRDEIIRPGGRRG
jgi:TMEM175 potassium channel family protein